MRVAVADPAVSAADYASLLGLRKAAREQADGSHRLEVGGVGVVLRGHDVDKPRNLAKSVTVE